MDKLTEQLQEIANISQFSAKFSTMDNEKEAWAFDLVIECQRFKNKYGETPEEYVKRVEVKS